jgi:hypothetical protein
MLLLLFALLWAAPLAGAKAQQPPISRSIELTPLAGHLSYGPYFRGPADVQFSNQGGIGYGAEFQVRVWQNLSAVTSAVHGTSDWSFESVPFLGRVTVDGASIWFFDTGLRLGFRLGGPLSGFVQATGGAVRYAVDNALLTDEAINLTFSGGVGLRVRVGRTILTGMVKDYIASFRSVDDLAAFGVEGQRAHTLAILFGFGFGW